MLQRTALKMVGLIGLLAIALAVAACTSGVAQEEYDAVKRQLATQEQQAASLQQQITAKEQELAKANQDLQVAQAAGLQATALQQQVTAKEQELAKANQDLQAAQAAGLQAAALQQQVTAKEKEVADLNTSLAAAQVRKPLIWTETKPLPAPAPTATPRPPGFVAPPAATPPPELVSEVVPFTFYVEHLTGHQTSTVVQYPSCVPNSQFRRGAHIVWRFEVFDTSTGKRLTGLDTDATIKVVMPNGEEKISRYSKRGGIGPWMWSAAWDVPSNYPLGTFDYQIVVTKGGRTGTFDQDKVALVRAATATAAGIDSRLQIVE